MSEDQGEVKMAVEAEEDTNAKGAHKTKTLYIWGLDKSLTQAVVKEEFAKFAQVTRVTIIKDKSTGTSKGFGYVECETPEDATKAMKEMDGRVIGENPVRIKYSFSETPDWLKYLDSKGDLGERPRQNRGQDGFGRGRGRGRFSGRGREYPGEDSGRRTGFGLGRYGDGGREPRLMGEDYYPYETATPGRSDSYERRSLDDPYKRRPHDDPYERRPIDVPYDRRPLDEPMERRPHPREDPFERRPRDDPYDTRPLPAIDNSYDERRLPPRRAAGEPYDGRDGMGGRDDIYSSTGKRDVYQERRDLYRPSDREGYMEPISRREQPRGRSPDPLRLPPVNYRARSPIDRPGVVGDRDRYERMPVRERLPTNPSNYYDANRNSYSSPPLHADEVRRVPEAKPAVSDYRPSYSYEPIRESGGRPMYEGSYSERPSERLPTKRGPPEHSGGRAPERRPDLYDDPYATVDSRKS